MVSSSTSHGPRHEAKEHDHEVYSDVLGLGFT